jgi:hypothetical protein
MLPTLLLPAVLPLVGAAEDDLLGSLARPREGRSRRATSTFRAGADGNYDPNAPYTSDELEHSNRDNFRVAPGATHVLMDEDGPGVITHIWLTFLSPEPHAWAPDGSANHQDMLLRITWDHRDKPGVEAPVGDFFACCFGQQDEVISLPVVVDDGDSYNCFWQMPFREHAKVEIVNQGDKPISLLYYNIDWIQHDRLPDDTPYFHAQYRQEYPVEQGKDYVLLETLGKGHYVGTVLAVRTRSPAWFGEGDERVWIDGEDEPSIQGTGTEDYFLFAWGLKTASGPYAGVPCFDGWGLLGGRTSIKVAFEHWGWIAPDENPDYRAMSWNQRQDDYSSVAYWYQTGVPTFTARAPDAAARRLPNLDRGVAYARDVARHGAGEAGPQQLHLYPGPQLLYQPPSQDDAWLELPFAVERREPLRLLATITRSYDFGRYQAYLDGVRIGQPLDAYSADIVKQEVHLLDFWPEPGEHVLRLECVGRNHASQGYYLGVESVRLRERRPRVAEFAHDRDKDWHTEPILYD